MARPNTGRFQQLTKDPVALTDLIESVLLTHQPTWDDCQQLLQALLTSEKKKQRVFLEARKHVLGDDGRPTQLPEDQTGILIQLKVRDTYAFIASCF